MFFRQPPCSSKSALEIKLSTLIAHYGLYPRKSNDAKLVGFSISVVDKNSQETTLYEKVAKHEDRPVDVMVSYLSFCMQNAYCMYH